MTHPTPASTFKSRHAVVIGGSVGGMAAARVLTGHFDQVTIIERDPEREGTAFRPGAPQARHPHILLLRGQQILDRLFPGFADELRARGGISINIGREANWFLFGGWRPVYESGINVIGCSRPLLEGVLAGRLAAHPQVQFIYQSQVTGLLTSDDRRRVTGVRLQTRSTGQQQDLPADLVVDASGRDSHAPDWLETLGFEKPRETTVNALPGYATRIYHRPPQTAGTPKVLYVQPTPPGNKRGAIITAMEGDRWHVTMIGMAGDYPPVDEAGFLEFARSLPTSRIYETIRNAEPVTDIYGYRRAENRLRHYEELPRYLDGFLVFGDAVYALNPVYGQGMTVAAIGSEMLDGCLKEQSQSQPDGDLRGLAARFQKRLAKDVVAFPWQMATGEDRRWATTEGVEKLHPVAALMQGYMDRVQLATLTSAKVTEAFYQVAQMVAPPTLLFRPDIVWQVLTAKRAAAKPAAQTRLAEASALLPDASGSGAD